MNYFRPLILLVLAGVAVEVDAQSVSYEFSGHIEVETNNPAGDPRHNLPFTASLTYSLDPAEYSSDWQPAGHFGEYKTLDVGASLELHYEGADYASDSGYLTSLEVFNDAGLFYVQGVPKLIGDQFGLWHHAITTTTIEYRAVTIGELSSPARTVTYNTPYLLKFLATDSTGQAFANDMLQTAVDFSQFDDLRIEIRPIVPVGTTFPLVPPPLYFSTVTAIIDGVRLVPEPATCWLALIGVFTALSWRRAILSAPSESVAMQATGERTGAGFYFFVLWGETSQRF